MEPVMSAKRKRLEEEVICRICYAEEFAEGNGAFVNQAKRKRQYGAGTICHACHSPYRIDLSDDLPRIPCAILGGTGLVGRQLAVALLDHPVFSLGPVVGSSKSVGHSLRAVWSTKEAELQETYGPGIWPARPAPERLEPVLVSSFEQLLSSDCKHCISAIAPRLGQMEDQLQRAGKLVVSISPHQRTHPDNVLVVPEVNHPALLARLQRQPGGPLPMIKSPNCVTCGVSVVIKALDDAFGVEGVSIATFQALSGRGDAKYNPELVCRNVYPLTGTEEKTDEYQRNELLQLFPSLVRCAVSAHRVPVQTGHFVDLKIQTRKKVPGAAHVQSVLAAFNPLHFMDLPIQPRRPIVVLPECGRPRPLQDSNFEKGMAVAVGNVRTDDGFFDVTLSLVVNNEVRS